MPKFYDKNVTGRVVVVWWALVLAAFAMFAFLVPLLTMESVVVRLVALTFMVLVLGAIMNTVQYLIRLLGT